MDITIKTIPHKDHRPEAGQTVGDWWYDQFDNLQIRVSEIFAKNGHRNTYMEALVAHHELTEALLCDAHGVGFEEVDEFDSAWMLEADGEPGDCIDAPYYMEHQIATGFERILAKEIAISWLEYDEAITEVLVNAKERQEQGNDPGEHLGTEPVADQGRKTKKP